MKRTRVMIVALVLIVIAATAAAGVVATSSSGSHDTATAAPATAAAPGATGVVGTLALVDPGGPMIAAGGSPAPAAAVAVELLSPTTDALIARTRVGAGGAFRVPVPPGSYRVRVAPAAGPSAAVSHLVDVTGHGYARLVIGPVRGL